jgi:hypothetical protein
VLFGYVEQVAELRRKHPAIAQQVLPFVSLLFAWLAEQDAGAEHLDWVPGRKKEVEEMGFNGADVKRSLEGILANDKHLRECFPALFNLAHFLDAFFITGASDLKLRGADPQALDLLFDEFLSTTYHQGRFKRIALSHLFNFDMVGNSTLFSDVRVERLDENTIPTILGETGFRAFLHPTGVGNCFVVVEEQWTAQADYPWISEKHTRALMFAQVLQYFKDGVVHVGYSVPYFQPVWLNQIRRGGLFFLGNPRREPYEGGKRAFFVSEKEKPEVTQWWQAGTSQAVVTMLADTKIRLRQAIWRAGTYYESSHERWLPVERLILLAIALESLFSPPDKGEFTFRIALSAAQFIGRTPDERHEIFKGVKDMYGRRSELFHGTYDLEKYNSGTFVTTAEVEKWASWIRRSLSGFLALYLTGETNRDTILNDIAAAAFDPAKAEKLRNSCSLQKALEERTARN